MIVLSPNTGRVVALRASLARFNAVVLVALRAWYEEWTAVARAEIKRRDLLITLGLAERKDDKKKAPKDPTRPPA